MDESPQPAAAGAGEETLSLHPGSPPESVAASGVTLANLSCTVIWLWFRCGLSQAKLRLKFSCQHNGIERGGVLKESP